MNSAHILRMQCLNLVYAFSGKNSILTQLVIRPILPNPVTFKIKRAGLTRHTNEPKNEEKDSNSSNASLFTSALLGFSCPAHASDTPK